MRNEIKRVVNWFVQTKEYPITADKSRAVRVRRLFGLVEIEWYYVIKNTQVK